MAAGDAAPVTVSIKYDDRDAQRGMAAMVRNQERELAKLKASFAGMSGSADAGFKRTSESISRSAANANFAVKNLGFQIGDIATQIGSGTGVLRAFATQADQIGMALRGMGGGVKGALAGLGGVLLDPWIAIPAAISLATVAMTTFFASGDKDAKELAAAIDDIANKFGGVAPAAKQALEAFVASEQMRKGVEQTQTTIDQLKDSITELVRSAKLSTVNFGPGAEGLRQQGQFSQQWENLAKEVASEDIPAALQRINGLLAELDREALENPNSGAKEFSANLRDLRQRLLDLEDGKAALLTIKDALLEAGKATDLAFERAADSIVNMTNMLKLVDPTLGKIATDAKSMADAFQRAAQDSKDINTQLEQHPGFVPGAVQGVPGGLTSGNVTFGSGADAKAFLQSRLAAGKSFDSITKLNDDFAVKLTQLLQAVPGLGIRSGWRSFDEQTILWNRSDKTGHSVARPGSSQHEEGMAVDLMWNGKKLSSATAGADIVKDVHDQAEKAGLTFPMAWEPWHVQPQGTGRSGERGGAQREREPSRSFEEQIAQNDKLIAQGKEELRIREDQTQSLDAREEALARLKTANEAARISEDLINKAKQDGIPITDALIARTQAQGLALAQLGPANDTAAVAMKDMAAHQEELKQKAEENAAAFAGMAKDFVGGFISDMMHGATAVDALKNALGRLADQLLDMAMNSLFDPKNFLGGGGGGGGNLISKLLGFGGGFPAATGTPFLTNFMGPWGASLEKGGIVGDPRNPLIPMDPRHFIGARSYQRGGMVGRPPGSIPIYAHPGEVVVPRALVGRGAVPGGGGNTIDNSTVNNDLGPVNIDMGTGVVAASNQDAKALGEMIRNSTEQILVRESRPGGLLRPGPGSAMR